LRHIQFLRNLAQLRFTGQVVRTDAAGQKWIFYLCKGQIIYATGGVHAVRRWRRNLAIRCPQMLTYRFAWQKDLVGADTTVLTLGWEYALLDRWVARQKITREQATKIILSTVIEVLFDIAQAAEISDQIRQDDSLSPQLDLIDVEDAIARAQLFWQAWQNVGLSDYSPNGAPVIQQPELLRRRRATQSYQELVDQLNGQRTLRDLALEMQRDIVEIAASLAPCIRMGLVNLISIHDLPAPIYQREVPKSLPEVPKSLLPAPKKALIACVDDSSLVRQMLEELLTSAGYRFVGIEDALRAIGVLLARKPDLIFLDLVMPNANGYEICQQLRKLSYFRNTPIVILTGNDGYANRLRSNFVGASDFLSKPLNAETVLSVIRKHLNQNLTPLSATSDR
jgi:chemotaxis family two-component system response regulator PixG